MGKVTIGNATLYHGNCAEVLPKVDALVTDPPYEIAAKGGGAPLAVINWWQPLYRSMRRAKHAEWSCGWETRKAWKGKPYLGFICTYYDGNHWCLHLGPFYIGRRYY